MRLSTAPDPVMRVPIRVTFLRMDAPPSAPAAPLPRGATVARLAAPTVAFYRYLYNTVGQAHLWWLRRIAPDQEIAEILADPRLSVHVLYRDGAPAGFYELDRRTAPDINLSYFGLLPHAIGQRLGTVLLRHAVNTAWSEAVRAITVNTCTADNPRALPGYQKMGFRPVREMQETWHIPLRLGFVVPPQLRPQNQPLVRPP